jgi:hypothetical protein
MAMPRTLQMAVCSNAVRPSIEVTPPVGMIAGFVEMAIVQVCTYAVKE